MPLAPVAPALTDPVAAARGGTLVAPTPDLGALGHSGRHGQDVAAPGDGADSGTADILAGLSVVVQGASLRCADTLAADAPVLGIGPR